MSRWSQPLGIKLYSITHRLWDLGGRASPPQAPVFSSAKQLLCGLKELKLREHLARRTQVPARLYLLYSGDSGDQERCPGLLDSTRRVRGGALRAAALYPGRGGHWETCPRPAGNVAPGSLPVTLHSAKRWPGLHPAGPCEPGQNSSRRTGCEKLAGPQFPRL